MKTNNDLFHLDADDFEPIWHGFYAQVDFTRPQLAPWQEIIKEFALQHQEPKLILKALEPLCSYLLKYEPEQICPSSPQGKKISILLREIEFHANPIDFIHGYLDIVQSNLGLDDKLKNAVGFIFKDHPAPKAFAKAVKWLAYTNLLNSDNLKIVQRYASHWFGVEALNQYYSDQAQFFFNQSELDQFVALSKVLPTNILQFHLACRLCLLKHSDPRLKTALSRIDLYFRENSFYLKYLTLFLRLPDKLSGANYPDKVILYFTKYLNANIFLRSNPLVESNLHRLIDCSVFLFDRPKLQEKWDLIYHEELTQKIFDDLVSVPCKTPSEVEAYLDALSKKAHIVTTPNMRYRVSSVSVISPSFFYPKPGINRLCPQIKRSIQDDKRRVETPNLFKR